MDGDGEIADGEIAGRAIAALAALAREVSAEPRLEPLLRLVVDRTAALLGTPRVSIRLLDPSRRRLIAACRAGEPLHLNAMAEFRLGEGLLGWIAAHARPLRTADAERDPRFLPRPDIVERLGSFLGVPLLSADGCIGVLSAASPALGRFGARHEDLLTLVAGLCAPQIEIARLTRLAQLDALTGVLNRRGLDLAFEAALPRDPAPGPLSVAMVDIDHFKRINDERGHAVGDEALRRLAARLSAVVRGGDAVVRLGGEEFLLVLPATDLERARAIADRLRAIVAAEPVPVGDGEPPVRLTISIGVAQLRPGEGRDALIERADAALYLAKQTGRDRVEVAS